MIYKVAATPMTPASSTPNISASMSNGCSLSIASDARFFSQWNITMFCFLWHYLFFTSIKKIHLLPPFRLCPCGRCLLGWYSWCIESEERTGTGIDPRVQNWIFFNLSLIQRILFAGGKIDAYFIKLLHAVRWRFFEFLI